MTSEVCHHFSIGLSAVVLFSEHFAETFAIVVAAVIDSVFLVSYIDQNEYLITVRFVRIIDEEPGMIAIIELEGS